MQTWRQFLTKRGDTLDGQEIRTCDWAEGVVKGIHTIVYEAGYILTVTPAQLTTCLLNTVYRHERDYRAGHKTTYRCSCKRKPYEIEEYEYYSIDKIPDSVWNALREYNHIEWYSDTGPFADRIWMDIPLLVFAHLNMETSPANVELEAQCKTMEDEGDLPPPEGGWASP
jgi:hypothetical protein